MPNELTEEILKFRADSLIKFLSEFSRLIKEKNKNILVSICVFPQERDPNLSWDDICSISGLDIFGSDPYWQRRGEKVEYVRKVTKQVVDVAKKHGKKSEIWIQCYKIPSGMGREIKQAVKLAASENPDYISAWTFRCGAFSVLSCENWEKCWKNLSEEYKEIQNSF
jgi:hypothetical protein